MSLLSIFVLAFAIQEPTPDPVPNAVIEGSVVDVIVERRIDAMMQRLEAQQSSIIDKAAERIEQRTGGKLLEIASEIRAIKEDRDGLRSTVVEFRKEHGTLIQGMKSLATSFQEAMQKWTPIQNGLDRLFAVVTKLFLLVIFIVVVVALLVVALAYLYLKLKSFISKEIKSVLPSVEISSIVPSVLKQ